MIRSKYYSQFVLLVTIGLIDKIFFNFNHINIYNNLLTEVCGRSSGVARKFLWGYDLRTLMVQAYKSPEGGSGAEAPLTIFSPFILEWRAIRLNN